MVDSGWQHLSEKTDESGTCLVDTGLKPANFHPGRPQPPAPKKPQATPVASLGGRDVCVGDTSLGWLPYKVTPTCTALPAHSVITSEAVTHHHTRCHSANGIVWQSSGKPCTVEQGRIQDFFKWGVYLRSTSKKKGGPGGSQILGQC